MRALGYRSIRTLVVERDVTGSSRRAVGLPDIVAGYTAPEPRPHHSVTRPTRALRSLPFTTGYADPSRTTERGIHVSSIDALSVAR